jgi:hypothetical protein
LPVDPGVSAGDVHGDPQVEGTSHACDSFCLVDQTAISSVYNHLHTVHAIESCNAAEIAMGMLMEATVPTSHRWIPKAMNVQYLEKATTSLRARARLDPPDFRGGHRRRRGGDPGQRDGQGGHRGGACRHHLLRDARALTDVEIRFLQRKCE